MVVFHCRIGFRGCNFLKEIQLPVVVLVLILLVQYFVALSLGSNLSYEHFEPVMIYDLVYMYRYKILPVILMDYKKSHKNWRNFLFQPVH